MGGTRLPSIHPGDILREDFLAPLEITAYRLAKETGLTETHIGDILRGERSVTATTALRLSAYFGTTPQFWLNLQNAFDLEAAREKLGTELAAIKPHPRAVEAQRLLDEMDDAGNRKETLVLA